ncbi:hypothetical protein SAMN05444397_110152 [Flavobacterium aquidurense]|uniref:DUF4251 domain-containing protein n=1 Tax=Flavobacterium frigidimaris TaxID=262320 RepID=A0ABX4BNI7_FLAFR|nr:hypothetical protein [Flavobacterium frigidimaris]OXA77998.1 hypothetical protein B0A65_14645 [Flavobacterium frigidimaris]SDZ61812.1 hypothetical protein SAMN05444397_110152 [Flavobacterium aquidurense]
MKNLYALFLLLFFVSVNYGQQSQTLIVDKAWVNDSEEWSDFKYAGQIVFSINPSAEEGSLRIGNYDFLYDICEGKAKFSNKATYSAAEFSHPRKVSVTTDKQGVVNSTYEGTLIFQSDRGDYYSVIAIVTILAKDANTLGLKMHLKEENKKEYAFSLKPTS